MVNIVTPPMSPIHHEFWLSDEEDFDGLDNNDGINLLAEFDLAVSDEDPNFLDEELIIPDLQRSDNMHEIDPLDDNNLPPEPPQLIRQNALSNILQNVSYEPINVVSYYPDPLNNM